jgi:hypothetical protein
MADREKENRALHRPSTRFNGPTRFGPSLTRVPAVLVVLTKRRAPQRLFRRLRESPGRSAGAASPVLDAHFPCA